MSLGVESLGIGFGILDDSENRDRLGSFIKFYGINKTIELLE